MEMKLSRKKYNIKIYKKKYIFWNYYNIYIYMNKLYYKYIIFGNYMDMD